MYAARPKNTSYCVWHFARFIVNYMTEYTKEGKLSREQNMNVQTQFDQFGNKPT